MELKDTQISNQDKFIQELTDKIENQKAQIRELRDQLSSTVQLFQKAPQNYVSGMDQRSKEDVYSVDGWQPSVTNEAGDNY